MAAIAERILSFLPGRRSPDVRVAPQPPVVDPVPVRQPHIEKDPRNPKLRQGIEELAELISFKPFKEREVNRTVSEEFPLMPSDLEGVRPLRRLLAIHRFPYVAVGFTVGGSINPDIPNVYQLFANRKASLTLQVLGETPLVRASALVIDTGRIVRSYRPDEFLDETVTVKRLRKKKNIYDKGEDDLAYRSDVRPQQIVNGVTDVVRSLRSEFLAQEEARAQEILTPTQRALVEAIRERAMAIHGGSNNRGFLDHFSIEGYVDSRERLEKISVVFSLAADSKKARNNAAWKNVKVFDGLVLPTLDRTTHFTVSPVNDHYYKATGGIGTGRPGVRRTPIELHGVNREGMMRGNVSDIPSQLFRRFLYERTGAFEFENKAPILLATSIKH